MDLLDNPFYILNATPRDSRHRIIELAEERSLLNDNIDYTQARSDLTNPRKRLSLEIAWLPGFSPKNSEKIVHWLSMPIQAIPTSSTLNSLSPLTRANILSSGLQRLAKHNVSDLIKWILELARAFEEIDSEKICAVINEERIVSGFPKVTDLSVIETEIQEQRLYYRQVIISVLKKLKNLSFKEFVQAVTLTVEASTENDKNSKPVLIDDMINFYEIETQVLLENKAQSIKSFIEKLKAAADNGQPDSTLSEMVDQLIRAIRIWDTVAQPIQISTKNRGLNHDASYLLSVLVRELSVELFNKHDKLELSQRLTNILREVFAEVVEVAEFTAEDEKTLIKIVKDRKLSIHLKTIFDLCKIVSEKLKENPNSAVKQAQHIINVAPQLISKLSSSDISDELVLHGKDALALILMQCAVTFGNKTEKWKLCIKILREAQKYASSQEVKERIQTNLNIVSNNDRLIGDLSPISSAPSLHTINGIGFKLYGSTDKDHEMGSCLSTYYFVFFFIPIFPICRYRVIPIENGYRFLGKASLRTFEKLHLFISLALTALFAFYIISESNSGSTSQTSPLYNNQPTRTSPTYNTQPSEITLAKEIKDGKSQAKQMEIKIEDMDNRLNDYKQRLILYRDSGMIDEYNTLLPTYNSLVIERNKFYKEYSSLVDDVNSMVKRYNSGYQ